MTGLRGPALMRRERGIPVGAALFMIIHFIHFSIHYYNDTT